MPIKTSLNIYLSDLSDVKKLGAAIFKVAIPGTVITLSGDIGVGKTTLARSIIHTALGENEEVLSPTFNLVHLYEVPSGEIIWHFDLYRLTTHEQIFELGIEDAFSEGISLIEWPDRLGPLQPPHRLEVIMTLTDRNEERQANLQGYGWWRARISFLKHSFTFNNNHN